jgi:hypothetical protein
MFAVGLVPDWTQIDTTVDGGLNGGELGTALAAEAVAHAKAESRQGFHYSVKWKSGGVSMIQQVDIM